DARASNERTAPDHTDDTHARVRRATTVPRRPPGGRSRVSAGALRPRALENARHKRGTQAAVGRRKKRSTRVTWRAHATPHDIEAITLASRIHRVTRRRH